MYSDLFEKVLNWITYKKFHIPSGYIPDKLLYKKISQKFILDKFMHRWLDNLTKDPIDIIDDMMLTCVRRENIAEQENNKVLLELYDIYIKALMELKRYILLNMI